MYFNGILVGLATFLIIGLFHPIVIKAEYYIGKRCWWIFMLAGIAFGILSLFLENFLWSAIAGATSFSCLWSILELFEQEKRVKKGWFPANPKRKR
jgi:branched-subunit amino acid transport protein